MEIVSLNLLLLFDAIFIFFLFLVSVSCLLYYLPLVPRNSENKDRYLSSDGECQDEMEERESRDGEGGSEGAVKIDIENCPEESSESEKGEGENKFTIRPSTSSCYHNPLANPKTHITLTHHEFRKDKNQLKSPIEIV